MMAMIKKILGINKREEIEAVKCEMDKAVSVLNKKAIVVAQQSESITKLLRAFNLK